ncbi:MAG: hypothetical protein VYD89_00400 [Candidatus Thermoplasmatota archaeon]|nr:hypothetical protein [Candidatus Thermoplasmatota archaeon]
MAKKKKFVIDEHLPLSPLREKMPGTWRFDCGYFLDEYAFLDGEDIPPWIRGLYCKKTV